jgi:hypothetical protein
MPDRSRKHPWDANQLAKFVVDVATGTRDDGPIAPEQQGKNPAAVAFGGFKGGKARAERLEPKERSKIARLAAAVRWRKDGHD